MSKNFELSSVKYKEDKVRKQLYNQVKISNENHQYFIVMCNEYLTLKKQNEEYNKETLNEITILTRENKVLKRDENDKHLAIG